MPRDVIKSRQNVNEQSSFRYHFGSANCKMHENGKSKRNACSSAHLPKFVCLVITKTDLFVCILSAFYEISRHL